MPRAKKPKYHYDGRYYQAKVRKDMNNARAGYDTLRGKTIAELDAAIAEYKHKQLQGLDMTQKDTVAAWISRWWANREADMSPAVLSYRKPMINNIIAPALGGMRLANVRPEDIKELMTSVNHRSTSYCNKLYQLLHQIFQDAYINGLVIRNPCTGVKYTGVATQEKEAIDSAQWETLQKAVAGTRAELFCNLGYYTGMRREEICGLVWDDVYLDAKTPYIHVAHATTWPDRKAAKWPCPLKTKNSDRRIPIHRNLLPLLMDAKENSISDFVVCTRTGEPLSYMSLRRLWGLVDDRTLPEYLPSSRKREYRTDATEGKNKKAPNVPKTIDFAITPHILRHTFATNLVASGLDLKKVQALTGHGDVTVLLKIYAHYKAITPDELVDDLNKAM